MVARGARLAKPAMLIGGVIGDQVEDYPDATAASLANQSFECAEVALVRDGPRSNRSHRSPNL